MSISKERIMNMKKNNIGLLFAVVSILSLSGCSDISVQANAAKKENGDFDKVIYRVVDKSYAVDVALNKNVVVSFKDPSSDGKHIAGSTVSFFVETVDDNYRISSVLVDGKTPSFAQGMYSFVMPNHDVTIVVDGNNRSDVDFSVEDVDDLPSVLTNEEGENTAKETAFFQDLKSRLQASDVVEGDYLKEATLSTYGEGSSFLSLNLPTATGTQSNAFIKAVENDEAKGVKVLTSYSSNGKNYYDYRFERGMQGNFYYEKNGRDGYYDSTSKKYISESETLKTYSIVGDSVEKPASGQINQSKAEYQSSACGFGSMILSSYFTGERNKCDYLVPATDSVEEHYYYQVRDMKVTKASDNKSFDYSFTLFNLSTSYATYKNFEFSFDGNGFMKKAKMDNIVYKAADYDATAGKVNDDAVMYSHTYFDISTVSGYKYDDGLEDLKKMAMTDYDMGIYMTLDGADLSFDEKYSMSHKVYDGAKLESFFFQNNVLSTDIHGVLKPTFVGVNPGEEDFIKTDTSGTYIDKVGTFHLIFDNGFGEKKTFEVTSVKPSAHMITTTRPDGVAHVGTPIVLNAKVMPAKADQSVTLAVGSNDTAGTTFVDNKDGSFTLNFAQEGTCEIVITSNENAEITKTETFEVYGELKLDTLKDNLMTKTFVGTWKPYASASNTYTAYINFNPDATGLSGIAQAKGAVDNTKYHGVSTVMTFKWTLDANTLAFTITKDDTESAVTRFKLYDSTSSYSDYYYDISSITMKSSSSGSFVPNRYSTESSSSGSSYEGSGSFETKVDFDTIK